MMDILKANREKNAKAANYVVPDLEKPPIFADDRINYAPNPVGRPKKFRPEAHIDNEIEGREIIEKTELYPGDKVQEIPITRLIYEEMPMRKRKEDYYDC